MRHARHVDNDAVPVGPRARQLFVDVIGHAGFKSAAPFVVFRDQPCDRRFDEGGLVSIEKEVYGLLQLCDGSIR